MSMSPTPDLRSNRRLISAAVVIILGVGALLAWSHGDITRTLGDTDDAMRLVRVRELLAGQGWFDQRIARLQPPSGSVMHWSRLLDGALAAMNWSLARVISPGSAEWATRFFWPLLWIGPAVVCVLSIARSLAPRDRGGRAVVLIAAVLMLIDVQPYAQFRPGRVDHHNVQIVMALIAAACAMADDRRARGGVLAGAATGLGLAIGIEALAFHAVIGAYFALRAAFDLKRAGVARGYALALVASSLGFFLIQTPPQNWLLSVCDAVGWNLIVAIVIAGLGLAAMASWAHRSTVPLRLGVLGLTAAVTAAGYLALDPACLHGPFAAVDPRLRPFWFDRIQELRSWPQMWRLDRDAALTSITMVAMGTAAAAVLILRRWREPAILLAGVLTALAGLAAANAFRMDDYAFWFGMPVLAVAIGLEVERWFDGALVPALAAAVLLSPEAATLALTRLASFVSPPVAKPSSAVVADRCFRTGAYVSLAALPPGVVLAPIDLGPFILAHTQDSVLAAPYHRMSWGILAAHDALGATAAAAQSQVRRLNVRYIVDCPGDLSGPRPASLAHDLRQGRVPDWLRALPNSGGVLRIYQVVAPAPDRH